MSSLFQSGSIGSMQLKNRFVRSATAEFLATKEGRVTDKYRDAYERLAKGGVGLIISGNFYVNETGRAYPNNIMIDKEEQIKELKTVTDLVHKHGSKIVAQINHAGRQCDPKYYKSKPIAPSSIRDMLSLVKPKEMTVDEIEITINAFTDAAKRIKAAGFDGIQIHAAHGYLINQFLSGHTNRRKDQWGGLLENRMRFLLKIFKRIRSEVGPDYPILIKINADDFIKRGVNLEEAIAVCKKLDAEGIDAIEVSGGIAERGLVTIRGDLPKDLIVKKLNVVERFLIYFMENTLRKWAHFEEAYFMPYATEIKKNVKVPVILVGGMRKRRTMEKIIENGNADFISLSRPFIRQPNLVNQMKKKEENVITCVNCNRCTIEMLMHHKPMKCYYRGPKDTKQ